MTVVSPPVKGVRRIVLLEKDQGGGYAPVVLFDRRFALAIGKRKKTKRKLRPLDKLVRQLADASETSASEFLARHQRSRVKKRNGWVRDLPKNFIRSQKAGRKRIKPKKIFRA